MSWRTVPSRAGWIGLIAVAAAAVVECGLLWWAVRSGSGPAAALLGLAALGLLPVALWLAYWTWGCFSLGYQLGRDGLVIRWAGYRQVVPMDSITHVLNGRPYESPLKGLRWPGTEIGRTRIKIGDAEDDTRPTLVYATAPPDGQLVVVTPSLAYAISPDDRVAFVDEFRARRRLGSVKDLQQHTELVRWLRLSVLADDGTLSLFAAALVVNLLMFYGLTWFFPTLPPEVAVGYVFDGGLGQAVAGTVQPAITAWSLPAIGIALLVGNAVLAGLVHRHTQLGARLLLLGALLLQLAIGVSLLRMA